MLMAALQFVMVPTYRALIVRKTFRQLSMPGALMERARTWLAPTDAKWKGDDYTWVFPSGAKLTFGHVEHDNAVGNYQSSNFHFIGIDEVTDLEESIYEFLMSRCRRDESDDYIPLRFRCASNPTGRGFGWVKKRFVLPCKDRKKASIFTVKNGAETERRFYIPANLRDNPYIDRAEYEKALRKLDPVMRRKLLDGDWDAKTGGLIFDTSFVKTIHPSQVPMERLAKLRYWDLAGTDKEVNPNASNTASVLYGVDKVTGADYILDVTKFQRNPTDVEYILRETAYKDGYDVAIRIEQEPGQSGKAQIWSFQEALRSFDVEGDLPGKRGSKETRAKPIANKIGRGMVYMIEADWNEDFLTDLETFPGKDGADSVDALSGAHACSRDAKKVQSHNRMRGNARRNKVNITYRGERM